MKDETNNIRVTTPSDTTLKVERAFDASPERIYDALTKPELVKQWLYGPEDWKLEVCDIDLRKGGTYRYEWHNPEKGIMGMSGMFRSLDRPNQIVHTELFDEDWTGGETVVTTDLEERGGETLLVMTIGYSTKAARDGASSTDMTDGMAMSYERLDELLLAQPASTAM